MRQRKACGVTVKATREPSPGPTLELPLCLYFKFESSHFHFFSSHRICDTKTTSGLILPQRAANRSSSNCCGSTPFPFQPAVTFRRASARLNSAKFGVAIDN